MFAMSVWFTSRKEINKMQHSLHGNSMCSIYLLALFLLAVLCPDDAYFMSTFEYSPDFNDFVFALALMLVMHGFRSFCGWRLCMALWLGFWSLSFPSLLWTCISLAIAATNTSHNHTRNCLHRCRKIQKSRKRRARQNHIKRTRVSKLLILALWFSAIWMPLPCQQNYLMQFSAPVVFHVHVASPFTFSTRWHVTRKVRNRRAHALNGNTSNSVPMRPRTKWESSPDVQGLSVANTDELILPENSVGIALRADQVSHDSVGIALCNSTFLQAKLSVRGGKYLCLVTPGILSTDLKSMIQAAKPDLLARCSEGCLTLLDPATDRTFVKRVVLINVGETAVTFADLPDTMQLPNDQSVTVWMHAYQTKAPDEWTATVHPSIAQTRREIIKRIAGILNVEENVLELWNFKISTDNGMFHGCLRATKDQSKRLYNCKDGLLFFRPFVRRGETPPEEAGTVIIWSKFDTISALSLVANTLSGIHGFVATKGSIGVRVDLKHITIARQALQKPNPKISAANSHVFGTMAYEVSGFPDGTSSTSVVNLLNSTTDENVWSPWATIPFRQFMKNNSCTWLVRADTEPKLNRLILQHGKIKLVIRKLPSKAEILKEKQQQLLAANESAEAARRSKILAETHSADPWSNWQEPPTRQEFDTNQHDFGGKGFKGKGKKGTPKRQETPMENSQLDALQKEVERLNRRVNAQDSRLDTIETNMSQQHQEIMHALRSLGASASTSPKPASRKRDPELPNTPLKALTEYDHGKMQKGRGK